MTGQGARDDEREALTYLTEHQWYLSRWGDGLGGYGWNCSCGVVSWGTAAENPARYVRHETEQDARLAAVAHIAAGYRKHPEPEITDEMVTAAYEAFVAGPVDARESMRAALEAVLRVPVGEGEQ